MEKIRVDICWCDHNYGAAFGSNVPGAVVLTAKTYDGLMKEIPETLRFHVDGMVADGDDVMIISDSGTIIRLHAADISLIGRNTQGVRLINLERRNDIISSVCQVSTATEDEDEADAVAEAPQDVPTDTETEETNHREE